MNIASLLRIACALVLLGVLGCGPEKPKVSLHQAVQKGDLKVVQQHIAARSDLNVADKNGWVPLHFAAMKGELAIVKALAAGGADLSRTGPGGRTPLDMAREKGQVAVAKFLMTAKPAGGNGGQGRGLVDGGLGVSEVLANP
jgi:ankyrin repeat protein